MVARARRENESFKQYRKSLKIESMPAEKRYIFAQGGTNQDLDRSDLLEIAKGSTYNVGNNKQKRENSEKMPRL